MLPSTFFFEGFPMGTKFAPTTFATSAEETLIAVDAYAVDSASQIQNSLPDALNVLNIQGLAGLRGGNMSAGLSLLTKKGVGLQFNADSLLKGIIGSNPALNSAMSQLTGTPRSNILNVGGYSQVTATINGIKANIANADLSSLVSVGNLIGGLSVGGQFPIQFTDVRGLSSLTTNIVAQATSMGIPDAYNSVSQGLTAAGNSAIMRTVTRDLAPIIINRSNTNLLSNVANGPYRDQLQSSRPTFIRDFSGAYREPTPTKASSYRPTLTNINQSFTQINPTWKNSRSLGGPTQRTLNLSRAYDVSGDFDSMLRANANYASVKVPATGYDTIDTSCRAVQSTPNLPYDMDLAQLSAIKQAMPADALKVLNDPLASLKNTFQYVPIG